MNGDVTEYKGPRLCLCCGRSACIALVAGHVALRLCVACARLLGEGLLAGANEQGETDG
jgi:hypothetical protein